MEIKSPIYLVVLALAIFFFQHTSTQATKKSYIVYLGMHSHGLNPTEHDAHIATQSHYDILGSILGSYKEAQESMLYSYKKYINGFVAKLTEDETERIKKYPNVVSVFKNRRLELHTTRSWEFLGLEQNDQTPSDSLWNKTGYGDGIIIGNLDTGVWPESESFSDKELGPTPKKWKGSCMKGSDSTFKCNKKLIGAKYFFIESNETKLSFNGSISPRDITGHGSHTLSIAGGNFVRGVSANDLGFGVAKGGSPNAKVAAYRVCWGPLKCSKANVLAAFEAAIGDGVDILSVSLGIDIKNYKEDGVGIGSYHAVRRGILVIVSAGNIGPMSGYVHNSAPWLFTVGASTLDRNFFNDVYLGNSTLHFKGVNAGPEKLLPKHHFHPLIEGASASTNSSTIDKARFCEIGSLDPSKVKKKIVICRRGRHRRNDITGMVVQAAGGIGMVVINDAFDKDDVWTEPHVLPASHLHYKDGQALLDYINKVKNPTAYISDAKTELGIKPAPMVDRLSSRGPSKAYPQILKPDITAPGVNVIGAYSGAIGPSHFPNDTRRVKYYFGSGTSMACPHVAGVAGLIKSMHPDWSPAAIRSAIMTTASIYGNDNKTILDYNGQQATPFAYGAGYMNPNAAANPGLIYNLTENDYLDFLCSSGSYTENDLRLFTPIHHECKNFTSILDFNYPSITVSNLTTSATLTRKVTNVGNPGTYEVKVTAPPGVNVTVDPFILKFKWTGEELVYTVELKTNGEKPKESGYVFGSLVWSDGTHNVRSPLVVERV